MYTPGDGFDDDGPVDDDPFECPDDWHLSSNDADEMHCPTCGYVVGGE